MPWVSNHSSRDIEVSINYQGKEDQTYTVKAAVRYWQGLAPATAETWAANRWTRADAETLSVNIGGKAVPSFEVKPDDHVTFYDDAYEIFTTTKVNKF
jgi:hypothetical protein